MDTPTQWKSIPNHWLNVKNWTRDRVFTLIKIIDRLDTNTKRQKLNLPIKIRNPFQLHRMVRYFCCCWLLCSFIVQANSIVSKISHLSYDYANRTKKKAPTKREQERKQNPFRFLFTIFFVSVKRKSDRCSLSLWFSCVCAYVCKSVCFRGSDW